MSQHSPEQVRDELLRLLEDNRLGHRPGSLLYSGRDTWKCGRAYVLGYNPGGSDPTPATEQVWRAYGNCASWNAYLDECWDQGGTLHKKGCAPMQRRVKTFLVSLGLDPRSTFASNLIFIRSVNKSRLEGAAELEERCWKIHQHLLRIVQPEIILALDLGAFRAVRRRTSPEAEVTSFCARHGRWRCFAATIQVNGRAVRMVGTPGLGRYAIDASDRAAVLGWLAAQVAVPPG